MIFERGYYIDSTVSTYENYPEKDYSELAGDLMHAALLNSDSKVLDFGCAIGLLVDCLRKEGIDAVGTDISYWAIKYGRERFCVNGKTLQHYNRQLLEDSFDCVLFLDVLEHIPSEELREILSLLKAPAIVVRIPVSLQEGEDFAVEIHKMDSTHIQCHDKNWWVELLAQHDYTTEQIIQMGAIYESPKMMCRVMKRIT